MKTNTLLGAVGSKITDVIGTELFSRMEFLIDVPRDLGFYAKFYECSSTGVSFRCDETESIEAIFVDYLEAPESSFQFTDLPRQTSRTEGRDKFGKPIQSGERQTLEFIGDVGAWDRFEPVSDVFLDVEYDESERCTNVLRFFSRKILLETQTR